MLQVVPCRLLLVHPSRLWREGLRCLLQHSRLVVHDAACAAAFVQPGRPERPDVVVWGAGIPAKTLRADLAALRARLAQGPAPGAVSGAVSGSVPDTPARPGPARHIVLTSCLDPAFMRQVARLDVDALLHDDVTVEVLLRSIELVTLGQRISPAPSPFGPATKQAEVVPFPHHRSTASMGGGTGMGAGTGPGSVSGPPAAPPPFVPPRPALPLSTRPGARLAASRAAPSPTSVSLREGEILHLLLEGASNKAIAHQLQITEATVKVHLRALFRKLGVLNRTQAALWAMDNPYHPNTRTAER